MDLYPQRDSDKPTNRKDEPESKEKTFLIPRGAFGDDCKPGDIYKVKVISVLDEELEVEPHGHDKKHEKEDRKEDKAERKEDREEEDMANPVDRYMG